MSSQPLQVSGFSAGSGGGVGGSSSHAEKARVVARFRPLSAQELSSSASSVIHSIDALGCSIRSQKGETFPFTFDACLASTAQQSEVFDAVGLRIIRAFCEGMNGCLLAYGQTGSGKTHTMFGPDDLLAALSTTESLSLSEEEARELEESAGIVPRCVQEVFEYMGALAEGGSTLECHLEVSCCEIYNETIRDLLDARSPEKANLQIVTGADGGPEVKHLSRRPVATPYELMAAVQ